jgi:hypothetical protein
MANPIDKESESRKRGLHVFISYTHRDEKLKDELDKHLASLKRSKAIKTWNDRKLEAGGSFDSEISRQLETSDIVLLLISPDFLTSDYCYCREMQTAIRRHNNGNAKLIPIILRPTDWHDTPVGHLLALPKDGKPVINWRRRDDALLDVAKGIRKVVDEILHADHSQVVGPTALQA